MTVEEENLATIGRWIELYNTDIRRMVDEVYADDAAITAPDVLEIGKEEFHKVEQDVLTAMPDRRVELRRAIAKDDFITAESILLGTDPATGKDFKSYWCGVFEFRGGRIISVHAYIDAAAWPGLPSTTDQQGRLT